MNAIFGHLLLWQHSWWVLSGLGLPVAQFPSALAREVWQGSGYLPAVLHVLQVPRLPWTVPLAGYRVFEHMGPWGHFPFQPQQVSVTLTAFILPSSPVFCSTPGWHVSTEFTGDSYHLFSFQFFLMLIELLRDRYFSKAAYIFLWSIALHIVFLYRQWNISVLRVIGF